MDSFDAVVIGAGQAGLGIAYFLRESGRRFVIFERGRIGETWRSQRWDSFALNTPNWSNGLPGYPYDAGPSDGFGLHDDLVGYFERYASRFDLPVRERTEVARVGPGRDGWFLVDTVTEDGVSARVEARTVVVASGIMHEPKVPPVSEKFDPSITQLHTADYRSPAALPPGAVLVVGSAQSGCQIAEDLIQGGRRVYVCTSRVGRVPRRYRGRDSLEWLDAMGFWDVTVADLPDPAMQYAPNPQVSGVGRYGSTLSLQHLHSLGGHLMGRLADVVDGVVTTDGSLAEHIAFADEFSAGIKEDIDSYIEDNAIDAEAPEPDPVDEPAGPDVAAAGLSELDLSAAGVSTVIWCTGFTATFDYIDYPVLDDRGHPLHRRGVSSVPGLYFLGLPWLHARKSGVIHGIAEDARHLAEHMQLPLR